MSAGTPTRPGRGRGAALPAGRYEPPPAVQTAEHGGVVVLFEGEDGRQRTFSFVDWPLPGLHEGLAHAFSARCGTTGTLRTLQSANGEWGRLRAFVFSLAELPNPPTHLEDLRVDHLKHHRAWLGQTQALHSVRLRMACLVLLLRAVPADRLVPELVDFLGRRGHATGQNPARGVSSGEPGYSDREFAAIAAAARSDVAAVRRRLSEGEALLDRALTGSELPVERATAAALIRLAGTDAAGSPPPCSGELAANARMLFLTRDDLMPFLVLGIVLTGRNGETVKELPAEHQVLEDRTVAVDVVKRRRGKSGSHSTVHWEIDARSSRQMHSPGSFYLLVHALTARSRGLSRTGRLWSIWAGGSKISPAKIATGGHIDPFACHLSGHLKLGVWAARHGLLNDDGAPLQLSFNRLKTTVDVRTTRAVGGHLPSAARTNTPGVLFKHYLRNDPLVRDWAQRVLTDAFDDAETHIREFAPTVLTGSAEASAAETGIAVHIARQAATGALDTLLGSCLDIDHNPFGPGRCTVSFLTCLQCPNALILERHLPRLLALADHLQRELEHTPVEEWVDRYGQAWIALVRFVLPQFTDAQRKRAAAAKPTSLRLDLLDGPLEES